MILPNDILAFVRYSFALEEQEAALLMLQQACIEDGTDANPRLLRCAVFASRGSLQQLERLVAHLKIDWRDVIMAGEYERRNKEDVHVRDFSRPM